MNTVRFRLVQTLSKSNIPTFNIAVLCCGLLLGALDTLRAATFIVREPHYRYVKFLTLLQSQQTHI
jgi:hypothetical protein